MFNNSDNDLFFKVHRFRLQRNDLPIWIDVYEDLNPTTDIKFHALPVDEPLRIRATKDIHIKHAKTLDDALNSCLDSIDGLMHPDLFEFKKK